MILSVELSTNLISRVCSSSHVNLISLGDVSALLRSGSGIGEPEITCLITSKTTFHFAFLWMFVFTRLSRSHHGCKERHNGEDRPANHLLVKLWAQAVNYSLGSEFHQEISVIWRMLKEDERGWNPGTYIYSIQTLNLPQNIYPFRNDYLVEIIWNRKFE